MKWRRITLIVALLAPPVSPAMAKKHAPPPPPVEGQSAQPAVMPGGYPYLLFVPRGYNASGSERWPLIIFLHGSGERGTDIERVKVHGPPQLVEHDPAFPFVLISPQMPPAADQNEQWTIAPLDAILDHALRTLRVDPARVYLTGLSLGGIATWQWGAAEPWRFAALAPVAGLTDTKNACSLKTMPIWAFHGDRDEAVDNASDFAMVRAIRACGGHPRLSLFPDRGHDSWDPAYEDPALYLWLLEQRSSQSKQ